MGFRNLQEKLENGQFCWRWLLDLCWHSGWVRKSPKLCWRNIWMYLNCRKRQGNWASVSKLYDNFGLPQECYQNPTKMRKNKLKTHLINSPYVSKKKSLFYTIFYLQKLLAKSIFPFFWLNPALSKYGVYSLYPCVIHEIWISRPKY